MPEQLSLDLHGGRRKRRKRRPRKRRQVINGLRFQPFHPVLGQGPRISRTWSGLRRELGTFKTAVRIAGLSVSFVTMRVSEDRGDTWRAATGEEQRLFLTELSRA